ncbi:hypothetical protein PMAYCL1PPCAC_00129, partial [Pristionchus mayeri]
EQLKTSTDSIRALRSKLIVLTDDFPSIGDALNSLNVESLTNKGHVVLVVCRQPFFLCITDTDEATFTKSGALALAPDDTESNRRNELFQKWLNESYEEKLFDRYRTTYDACYAFCWGATRGNTNNGKKYSETFANASWTNSLGTTRFDGGYSLMQVYSVYKMSTDKDHLLTLTPSAKQCINSTCLSMAPTVTNPDFWQKAADRTVDYAGVDP